MSDLVREILAQGGAEHQTRRPAEVIEHPLRSKFLERTSDKPEGTEVPSPLAYALITGPYVSVAFLAMCFLWAAMGVHGYFTRQAVLADIGRVTCSADGSYLWIEDDPGSSVPRMRDELLAQCARAYRMF